MTVETMDVADEIATFLKGRFPAFASQTVDSSTPLLSGGAIDSLGILDLVTFLDERLGVQLTDEDFDPANFETLGLLVAFVERQRA